MSPVNKPQPLVPVLAKHKATILKSLNLKTNANAAVVASRVAHRNPATRIYFPGIKPQDQLDNDDNTADILSIQLTTAHRENKAETVKAHMQNFYKVIIEVAKMIKETEESSNKTGQLFINLSIDGKHLNPEQPEKSPWEINGAEGVFGFVQLAEQLSQASNLKKEQIQINVNPKNYIEAIELMDFLYANEDLGPQDAINVLVFSLDGVGPFQTFGYDGKTRESKQVIINLKGVKFYQEIGMLDGPARDKEDTAKRYFSSKGLIESINKILENISRNYDEFDHISSNSDRLLTALKVYFTDEYAESMLEESKVLRDFISKKKKVDNWTEYLEATLNNDPLMYFLNDLSLTRVKSSLIQAYDVFNETVAEECGEEKLSCLVLSGDSTREWFQAMGLESIESLQDVPLPKLRLYVPQNPDQIFNLGEDGLLCAMKDFESQGIDPAGTQKQDTDAEA